MADRYNITGKLSHPVRGAWIEISTGINGTFESAWSHPVRGAWIEIEGNASFSASVSSHPVRGAWIEIYEHP